MKILWTFDPFDRNKKLHKVGTNILSILSNKNDQIKVAYVASNAEVNLATAFDVPKEKRYTDYPKKLIKKELSHLGLKKAEIEVLPTIHLSLSSSVKQLTQLAKKNKTDLILIATNARTLLPRLIFGSFAETLIHLSLSDVLVYHQKTKFGTKPKNILYAHDFTMKGSLGLLRVTEYAKKWNSSLTVVHIVNPEFDVGDKQDKSSESYRQDVLNQAQKIEKSLQAQKINISIYLESSFETPSTIILNIAKKTKADMIALTAKSGNLTALLGGSITRQVLRESALLTLVLKV